MFSLYFDLCNLSISHFGFEDGTLVLIASVPGHGLPFFLFWVDCLVETRNKSMSYLAFIARSFRVTEGN